MNFNIFFPSSSRYSSGQKFYSLTWQTMHYFRQNPWTSSKINGTSILGMRGARNLLLPTGLAPLMQISQRGQIFPEVAFLFSYINGNLYAKISVLQIYRSINCNPTACDQFLFLYTGNLTRYLPKSQSYLCKCIYSRSLLNFL